MERNENKQPAPVMAEIVKAVRAYGSRFREAEFQSEKWHCIQALVDLLDSSEPIVAQEVPTALAKVSNVNQSTPRQWKDWYAVKQKERKEWAKVEANARAADNIMNPATRSGTPAEAAKLLDSALERLEKIVATADPEEKGAYTAMQSRLTQLKYGLMKTSTIDVRNQ